MAVPSQKRQRRKIAISTKGEASYEDHATATAVDAEISTLKVLPAESSQRRTVRTATTASPRSERSRIESSAAPTLVSKRCKANTIHSFFNARTQAQTCSSASLCSSNIPESTQEEEQSDIEDDDLEGVHLKRQTSKRKYRDSPAQARRSQAYPARHKIITTQSQEIVGAETLRTASSVNPTMLPERVTPWADKFHPANVEELAVNKRKVAEVDVWLQAAASGHQYRRLLVLKGPAGSGKTATVLALAKSHGWTISEWTNPVLPVYGDENYVPISKAFEEYITRGSNFRTLRYLGKESDSDMPFPGIHNEETSLGHTQIGLIEELPVTSQWSSIALASFRRSIMMHLSAPQISPIVMIISENDGTFFGVSDALTAHQLLGSEILQDPSVSVIDFKAVAVTFLSKALELVIKKEARASGRRQIPALSVLRALAETGDIRSAIGMLEFMCINEGDSALYGRVGEKGRKPVQTKSILSASEQAMLQAITQRGSSLGLFHAVGKVVYNKREDSVATESPEYMIQNSRPQISVFKIDDLYGITGTDVATFIAALHENYPLSCHGTNSLAHLDACLDYLSTADILATSDNAPSGRSRSPISYHGTNAVDLVRHNELTWNVAVRGIFYALPYPVNRKPRSSSGDPYKLLYPASLRLRCQCLELSERIGFYMRNNAHHMSSSATQAFTAASMESGAKSLTRGGSVFPGHVVEDHLSEFAFPIMSKILARLPQNELVLIQLPYVAMIFAQQSSLEDLHLLQQIVSMKGYAPDSVGRNRGYSRTDPRTSGSHSSGSLVLGSQEYTLTRAQPLREEKLVLSEDDIEDD